MRPELSSAPDWRHPAFVVTMIAATLAVLISVGLPPLATQVVCLAIGVALFGVPHGALDHRPASRVLRPCFRRAWWPVFLALYLGLSAVVFAAFAALPRTALVIFLLLSIIHFGLDAPRGVSVIARFAWGAPAIILPCYFSATSTASLFGQVAANDVPMMAVQMAGSLGLCLWLLAFLLASTSGQLSLPQAVRLAAYVPLFALTPPLMAFLIYFCCDHSLRHLLHELAVGRNPVHRSGGATGSRPARLRLLLEAAPATLATLAGSYLLWRYWHGGGAIVFETSVVRVVFQVLAALTVPHMALAWLDARSRRADPWGRNTGDARRR